MAMILLLDEGYDRHGTSGGIGESEMPSPQQVQLRKIDMVSVSKMVLFVVVIFALEAEAYAQQVPEDLVLQRFSVAKGGDDLILPVKINGRKFNFLLDTGASLSVCDKSVPVGKRQGDVELETPEGTVTLRRYDLPETEVGKLRFVTPDPVAVMDLKLFQEVIEHRIDGILGLDFLNRHVVRFDFDRGEVLFLKSIPSDSGEVVDLSITSKGMKLSASMAGVGEKRFIIDTGFNGAGWLEADSMRRHLGANALQVVAQSKSRTLSGDSDERTARGRRLSVGSFSVVNPLFDEMQNCNALGLQFWARFVVTIDFPAQKLYLRKGEHFSRPERPDVSGLHILRKGEAAVIDSVDTGSPGTTAGIRSGDVLVQVGTLRAAETTLFHLRATLREPGAVPCVIRRDKTDSRVTLTIPDWSKTPFGVKP